MKHRLLMLTFLLISTQFSFAQNSGEHEIIALSKEKWQ